jgi:hypothetical protein
MANAVQVQILQDGPRNTVAKFTGELDTAATNVLEAYNVKLAPLTYQTTYNLGPYVAPATWRLDFIEFALSDQFQVTLYWDATTPQVIMPIAGRGNKHFKNFGGISGYTASSAAGWSGGIGLAANLLPGATAPGSGTGDPLIYSIVLDLVKQGPVLS